MWNFQIAGVWHLTILSAIRVDPGYLHGDLDGGNTFVLPNVYRVSVPPLVQLVGQTPNAARCQLDASRG